MMITLPIIASQVSLNVWNIYSESSDQVERMHGVTNNSVHVL